MAGERIAALTSHLVLGSVPPIAELVALALREPEHDPQELVDRAFEHAVANVHGEVLRAILGSRDYHAEEAFAVASRLCIDAIMAAMGDPRVWDRRRTRRTRQRLLAQLAGKYVGQWMRDRGMDLSEARWLQEEGEVR